MDFDKLTKSLIETADKNQAEAAKRAEENKKHAEEERTRLEKVQQGFLDDMGKLVSSFNANGAMAEFKQFTPQGVSEDADNSFYEFTATRASRTCRIVFEVSRYRATVKVDEKSHHPERFKPDHPTPTAQLTGSALASRIQEAIGRAWR